MAGLLRMSGLPLRLQAVEAIAVILETSLTEHLTISGTFRISRQASESYASAMML